MTLQDKQDVFDQKPLLHNKESIIESIITITITMTTNVSASAAASTSLPSSSSSSFPTSPTRRRKPKVTTAAAAAAATKTTTSDERSPSSGGGLSKAKGAAITTATTTASTTTSTKPTATTHPSPLSSSSPSVFSSSSSSSVSIPLLLSQQQQPHNNKVLLQMLLPVLFVILQCIKILLIPTYKSTDFDVHRNWLAITSNLPLNEWYFHDLDGRTVHTLDYPPAFAFFQYLLAWFGKRLLFLDDDGGDDGGRGSNAYGGDYNGTNNDIAGGSGSGSIDRCLHLLPDDDNEPSTACVVFQRSTVIISDLILWMGAYAACYAMHYHQHQNSTTTTNPTHQSINHKKDDGDGHTHDTTKARSNNNDDDNNKAHSTSSLTIRSNIEKQYAVTSFILIVFNPGLLWLDHIHFQYNGMLMGILLASLACIVMGNHYATPDVTAVVQGTTRRSSSPLLSFFNITRFDLYHWGGAALFALLLNLKHLYIPLAPLYFCYLLERYCLSSNTKRLRVDKLIWLAIVAGTVLILPWIPFLMDTTSDTNIDDDSNSRGSLKDRINTRQLVQIMKRLFPFGRGLVHDYWAANVWAIYSFFGKLWQVGAMKFILASRTILSPTWYHVLLKVLSLGRIVISSTTDNGNDNDDRQDNNGDYAAVMENIIDDDRITTDFLSSFAKLSEPSPTVCAVLLFLFVIPGMQVASARLTNRKFIEAVVYVSFSSFMLAYHVHEKAVLTTLVPLTLLVEPSRRGEYHNILFWHSSIWGLLGLFPLLFRPIELTFKVVSYFTYLALVSVLLHTPPKWTREIQYVTFAFVVAVIIVLEVAPIQGKWEFLPLMFTSVSCAFGLLGCWAMSLWLLANEERH